LKNLVKKSKNLQVQSSTRDREIPKKNYVKIKDDDKPTESKDKPILIEFIEEKVKQGYRELCYDSITDKNVVKHLRFCLPHSLK
jgi:hypothetical protein